MKLPSCTFFVSSMFLLSYVPDSQGHSRGAPSKSCRSMKPHHKHVTFQETGANINAFIIDGNLIEVELESNKPFKGFILQARSEEDDIIGTFEEGINYKLMKCEHKYGNSLTHTNSREKSRIVARWKNEDAHEKIIFKAVVVYDYKRAQRLEHEIQLDYSVRTLLH